MPVTPEPAAPPYPPLTQVFPLASLGQQVAMVFLILTALAGFAVMTLLWTIGVQYALQNPWLFSQELFRWQLVCTILDTLVFGHCLFLIRYRGRSWIAPILTFAFIAGSLVFFTMDLAQDDFSRNQAAYIQMIALHSGIQILTAGALIALRRIHWIGWLPQEESRP
jgi:hypothetical protein